MRYYQHHIGDFNNATRHLSRVERSIYRDLIELYYETEKQLPLDAQMLCRLIVANECSTDVERLLNEFFTKTPDGWYHSRCEDEISKYRANNSQKSQAGRASAAAKELKRQRALNGSSTDVQRQINVTPTNHEPVTLNHKKPAAQAGFVLPEWIPEDTWAAYCKVRTGKGAKNEPHALGLIVADLLKFKAADHDPVECLNNSIKGGWAVVFEPKARQGQTVGFTVPGKPGRDPELVRIDIERSRAAPMPAEIREQIQKLKLGELT